MDRDDTPAEGVIAIPFDRLSSEALQAIIDEFVTREGTEYGLEEVSLADKRQQVMQQLKQGTVSLLFDPVEQTCHIALTDQLGPLNLNG